jgi:hypothetical protein
LKVNFYLKKSCFSLLLAIFDHFSWKSLILGKFFIVQN